jgi:hypothetical protein
MLYLYRSTDNIPDGDNTPFVFGALTAKDEADAVEVLRAQLDEGAKESGVGGIYEVHFYPCGETLDLPVRGIVPEYRVRFTVMVEFGRDEDGL